MTTMARTASQFVAAMAFGLLVLTGCQQKMADQPAPRTFDQHDFFPHNQSARPLERGVVHRNQHLDDHPLVNWLTEEGRKGDPGTKFTGEAAYDPKNTVPPIGAPTSVDKFVNSFPFEIKESDLLRGQTLFNSNCALCHGAAGYGNGKIVERGVLRPPSYHVSPRAEKDWSTLGNDSKPKYTALDAGYSRGFYRWGVKVPLKSVPVGYIFQVITWGYGGMASHETQLPNPADRWRVIAYLRTLQLSQSIEQDQLPESLKQQLTQAGGPK